VASRRVAPPTLERTHYFKHDLDWLPPSFQVVRWTVAGSLWTALAASVAGVTIFTRAHFYLFGKSLAVLAAGGYYAGDRAARAALRARLKRLAHGSVDLSRLRDEADGELVHVRGRVRAREHLLGLLDPVEPAVYRRVIISMGRVRMVHEAAVDFLLVDESGQPALCEVANSRLVAPEPRRRKYAAGSEVDERLRGLPLLPLAWERGRKDKASTGASAGEILLQDGDEVEAVGYKSRVVDPSVATRLERDTPMRETLRGGKALPLIISPVSIM
jgi:hypothetical protein